MLRVVFALHCVARRACRPVTPRSQIQRAPRQMSIRSSSFSGGRSPTSIYGMRLPPFGFSASRRLNNCPTFFLIPPSPLFFSPLPNPPFPLYNRCQTGGTAEYRSLHLACRLPPETGRCIKARGKNEGMVDRCVKPDTCTAIYLYSKLASNLARYRHHARISLALLLFCTVLLSLGTRLCVTRSTVDRKAST